MSTQLIGICLSATQVKERQYTHRNILALSYQTIASAAKVCVPTHSGRIRDGRFGTARVDPFACRENTHCWWWFSPNPRDLPPLGVDSVISFIHSLDLLN